MTALGYLRETLARHDELHKLYFEGVDASPDPIIEDARQFLHGVPKVQITNHLGPAARLVRRRAR